MRMRAFVIAVAAAAALGCKRDRPVAVRSSSGALTSEGPSDPKTIADGRDIFRFDTYGNERFGQTRFGCTRLFEGGESDDRAQRGPQGRCRTRCPRRS